MSHSIHPLRQSYGTRDSGVLRAWNVHEVCGLLDCVDRWDIAAKLGIDNVHSLTRVELFRALELHGRHTDFASVMADISSMAGYTSAHALPIMNVTDFLDGTSSEQVQEGVLAPFADAHSWLRDQVGKHCPFVLPSLGRSRMWMTSVRAAEQSGEKLFQVLMRVRDAFAVLDNGDRNDMFNAVAVLLPGADQRSRGAESVRSCTQDIGPECGRDLTVGAFLPCEPASPLADPRNRAPAMFVFRHSLGGLQVSPPARK